MSDRPHATSGSPGPRRPTHLLLVPLLLPAAPLLLPAAIMMVWLRVAPPFAELWPTAAAPRWLSIAVAVFTVYGLVTLLILERQILHGRAGERVRAKGDDPQQFMALTGAVMALSPLSMALFVSIFGLGFLSSASTPSCPC